MIRAAIDALVAAIVTASALLAGANPLRDDSHVEA